MLVSLIPQSHRLAVRSPALLPGLPARRSSGTWQHLPVATELRRCGHRVQILTGSRFGERVTAVGLEHVSLPWECDFDAQDLDAASPEHTTEKGRFETVLRHR